MISNRQLSVILAAAFFCLQVSDAQVAVRCEHLLEAQREYDRTKHALTVASVLQDLTKEMKNAPVADVLPLLEHNEWELRYAAATATRKAT
ncbi:MAG: hypothetical protein HN919_21260 [Verrucomicrobia bacterium]|jgi:hypothetical protein|nr:hypothetical protein [Verrucomicrobiota bacterium]MBT7699894.1 hypothetical protein [Verrucomicrobiota bacterium]